MCLAHYEVDVTDHVVTVSWLIGRSFGYVCELWLNAAL